MTVSVDPELDVIVPAVPKLELTLQELNDPELPNRIKAIDNYGDFFVRVEFSDRRSLVYAKRLVISYFLWATLRIVGLYPKKEDMYQHTVINNALINQKNTELYFKALDWKCDFNVGLLIRGPWAAIHGIFHFSFGRVEAYVQSSDILDLTMMMQQPELKEIASITLPDAEGSEKAEKRLEQSQGKFMSLISVRGALKYNPLINFIECEIMNPRQISQVFIAIGPRADITDKLPFHIISESYMSGLKTKEDFVVEILSAKKATLYSRTVIEDTQYFNRKQRLCTNTIRYLHKGDCGNRRMIPFVLPDKASVLKNNFIGKTFYMGDQLHALTDTNYKEYAGKLVNFISPLTCFYAPTGGVCEHCMGLNNRHVKACFSPTIHIGNLAAAYFSGSVSQMVLSAKHLIKTATKLYFMNSAAGTYFACKGTGIFLHPQLATRGYTDCAFKFAHSDFLGQITDLNLSGISVLPEASIFTKISGAQFCVKVNGDWRPFEIFSLENDGLCPFFSTQFLQHIHDHYSDVVLSEEEGSVLIPLKGFDWRQPILRYIAINDDMIAFSNRLINFFKGKIRSHTSISGCLQELSSILYSRSKLPFVYLELVLLAFVLDKVDDDMISGSCNRQIFGSTEEILSNRSISNKFSYEKVLAFLDDPEVFTAMRQYGYYDAFFDFGPPIVEEELVIS